MGVRDPGRGATRKSNRSDDDKRPGCGTIFYRSGTTTLLALLVSLCAMCLLVAIVRLNPINFQTDRTSGHQQNKLDKSDDKTTGENGWLLFEVDPSQSSSSSSWSEIAANKSPTASAGYKWATGPLLEDFGSAFDLDEAASVGWRNQENAKHEEQDDNYPRNRYSETQRDLRELRRLQQHGERTVRGNLGSEISDTPTFKFQQNPNPIETLTANRSSSSSLQRRLETSMSLNRVGEQLEGVKNSTARVRRRKRRAGSLAAANERGKPILNEFSFPANLVQGMRFVLMCQVLDGEPPIQIKWLKDNTDLATALLASASGANQDNSLQGTASSILTGGGGGGGGLSHIEMISNDELGSSLLFRRVKQQHSGNYTCLASNHLGSASYSSLMTVKVPPSWRIEPQDQESIMGEQITIDCQATGNPNPFIRWKFASGSQFDKMISSSTSPQAAQGQLQATGTITSNQQQQHQLQQHLVSNQFKLINSNHHVQTLENGSLIIRQAAKEHEGLYLCEADNGVEPSLVKQMKLIVHKQVHFVDEIQVILQQQQQQQNGQAQDGLMASAKGSIILKDHVTASSTAIQSNQVTGQSSIKSVRLPQNSSLVRLVCLPLGDTPIQLEWLKDGRLIHTHSSGPAPSGSSSSSNNNNIEIALADSPSSLPTTKTNDEHSSTIGRYHVSTRWSYASGSGGASRTPIGLESELLLTNLNRHDAGLYTCAARNAFGQSERKLRLIVQEPPEAPTLVDVAHISSRAIALRWSAPFDGNSPILEYVIEYRRQTAASADRPDSQQQQQQSDINSATWPVGRSEKLMPISNLRQPGMADSPSAIVVSQLLASGSGSQVQHTVHDLEPLTRYSMQVIAINALGQSKPSVALSLRTEEEVPATVPNLVEAAVLSSRSIKLRWTISYALEHELIDGFFIGYRSFDDSTAGPLLQDGPPLGPPTSDASGNAIPNLAATNNPKQFTYKTIRLTNQHMQPPGQDDQVGESSLSRAAAILSPVSSVTKLMPIGALKPSSQPGGGGRDKEVAYAMSTFEHVIGGLERNTEYTFLIQCFNKKGAGPTSDPVVAKTLMSDPPEKLTLIAEDLSETSLRVNWHFPGETTLFARASVDSSGRQPVDPVDGFLLTFAKIAPRAALAGRGKSPTNGVSGQQPPDPAARIVQQPTGSGDTQQQRAQVVGSSNSPPIQANQLLDNQWQAIQLAPQQRTHILKQLECGSWYALKISAFNRVGKGEPSDLVTSATRGKAPLAPTRSQFLAVNSTQVRLHLGAWHDGGCSIDKFIVQYRARMGQLAASQPGPEPWILVSNNVQREQQSVLIRDLAPATTYELLVSAQNHVGLSEAKYRFSTLDSEGKQVVVASGGGSFFGTGDSDEDSNSFVDYSDDSGVRRESYGNGPEGSMYLGPAANGAGPSRWLSVARQVLNSPLTLLLTFCVFLVLLGLLLFHRFNNNQGGGGHSNNHHHHHAGQMHEGNYHSTGGGAGSAVKLSSTTAVPNHMMGGRCSIDGLATIIDGEPPLSSSSAATDSPARMNMTDGNSRLANGGYAPLDCGYGGGTYCSGGLVAPPGVNQDNYGVAHQLDCFPAPDSNYSATTLAQQQQQQVGYYPQRQHAGPTATIYGTAAGSHDQQCLMQMLLMSPGQEGPQGQVDSCTASASALATMARQKAGLSTNRPMSGHAYSSNQNHLTLGRQLLDIQRAQTAAVVGLHQGPNQQADSYQMSTFQRQDQDLISIQQEEEDAPMVGTMSLSLASSSGRGTTSATASTSLSLSVPAAEMGGEQHASRSTKSESCDSALDEQSCNTSSSNNNNNTSGIQNNKCDRTFQYDVPFNTTNNMSHRALKLNVGSSSRYNGR